MFIIEQQIAVVTGVGHSKDIGAATCRELAAKGMDIFFTYWEALPGWPDTFQKEIQDFGVQCAHAQY